MEVITIPVLFAVMGLLLSLNPVTIAVFTALLAGSYGKKISRSHMAITSALYLVVLAALFVSVGVAWLRVLQGASLSGVELLTYIVSLLCIGWGAFSLKDFYWYTGRNKAPKFISRTVHKHTVKKHKPLSAGVLAITTAYAVTPSMGLPFIGLVTLGFLLGVDTVQSPFALTFILLVPLLCIYVLSLTKLRLSAIMKWRQDSRMTFRLTIGLTTLFIGWLLLLVLNGTLGVAQ